MNVRLFLSLLHVRRAVLGTVLSFASLLCHQAKADVVSSICAPGAHYFELRTFQGGFDGNHVLASQGLDRITFTITTLAAWLKNPEQCTIKNIFGYDHTVEVRAVNYFPGSNAVCSAEQNATIEILLDGTVFEHQEFVYGACQPMETLTQFNGASLFFCSFPDLNAITGVGNTPQWTMEKEAKGDISIQCKKIDILAIDAKRNHSEN